MAADKLTKRDIRRIVGHWQKVLRLDNWTVGVSFDDPAPDDAHADITRNWDYHTAQIRLDPVWRTWDRHFANVIVCHELCHLSVHELHWAAQGLLASRLDDDFTRDLANATISHAVEGVVQRLAEAFVGALGAV